MHIVIVVFKLVLGQEGSLESFGGISVDIDEIGDTGVNVEDEESKLPNVGVNMKSVSKHEVGSDQGKGDESNVGYESVVLHGRVGSDEVVGLVADLLALPG